MSRTSKLILGVQDLSIKPLSNPRLTRLLISHPVDPVHPVELIKLLSLRVLFGST